MQKCPAPYIQNHINWCWATAAKIVGLDYCATMNRKPACVAQATAIVARSDVTGLRPNYVGHTGEQVMVDALQQEIVLKAGVSSSNPEGNMPESDDSKRNALRYVITGDTFSSSLDIVTRGHYQNPASLLVSEEDALCEIVLFNRSLIGNYVKHNGKAHSVVLRPAGNQFFTLYDPWDGFTATLRIKQLFQTGFLTNQGPGVIQWMQYIR